MREETMPSYADRTVRLLAGQLGEVPPLSADRWAAVEEAIGLALPEDCRSLVSRTGSIIVDEWLTVYGPDDVEAGDLGSLVREREEAWTILRRGGVPLREEYLAGRRRLIAFASVDAAYFYWRADPAVAPEKWGVVLVDGDLTGWYPYEMPATEVLYKVLVGEIVPPPVEGLFGQAGHEVERFG